MLRKMSFIKKPMTVALESTKNMHSKTIVNINLKEKSKILEKVFLACTNCDGPLVPISSCTFCKRVSFRKCTVCDKIRDMESHESCKILISFGHEIVQKHITKK